MNNADSVSRVAVSEGRVADCEAVSGGRVADSEAVSEGRVVDSEAVSEGQVADMINNHPYIAFHDDPL